MDTCVVVKSNNNLYRSQQRLVFVLTRANGPTVSFTADGVDTIATALYVDQNRFT